jgi:HAD superfamily hydrolase (TIGR01509 family)
MKALFFDMDGTIVNNMGYHHKARAFLLQKYGVQLTKENYRYIRNSSFKSCLKHFFENEMTEEQVKELGKEKQNLYRDLYKDHIKEVEGLKQLLKIAKRKGFYTGLATMSDMNSVEFILGNLGVNNLFNHIISGEHVSKGKPNPEIYNSLLSVLPHKADNVIAFEDSKDGTLAAKYAGINVIGVCTTQSKQDFERWGAITSINSYLEFINIYL